MKKLAAVVFALMCAACAREAALDIEPGSSVSLQKNDGVTVQGRLVEIGREHVVVETPTGRTQVPRAEIKTLTAETAAVAAAPADPDRAVGSTGRGPAAARPEPVEAPAPRPEEDDAARTRARVPEYREVVIPAGTVLPVELSTAVGSATSRIEDPVRGTLRRPVTIDGVQVLPAGASVSGHVTAAERSARVKGRARVAFRFTTIDPPGDAERLSMRTDQISRLASATKRQDAAKIGGGAAGGAIIGGILGGGDGAAKGAAIGGAAGTGVVLSTRGREVQVPAGTPVSVRLAAPLTVRVRTRG